jgi:hypothetical protein
MFDPVGIGLGHMESLLNIKPHATYGEASKTATA